jgi:hypothetical protein
MTTPSYILLYNNIQQHLQQLQLEARTNIYLFLTLHTFNSLPPTNPSTHHQQLLFASYEIIGENSDLLHDDNHYTYPTEDELSVQLQEVHDKLHTIKIDEKNFFQEINKKLKHCSE